MSVGAITTEARAVQVHRCHCGTDRLPTLRRMGSRSYLVQYVCRACGTQGVNAISAERAAKNWNADMAKRKATR